MKAIMGVKPGRRRSGRAAGAGPAAVLAAGCVCAGVIAGCGSGGNASGSKAGGEASKPASKILADSAAALRSAGSFRIQGTMTQVSTPSKRVQLAVDVYSSHALTMSMASNGASATVILDGSRAFMRANQAFWSATASGASGSGKSASALLANRWLIFPMSQARSLASSTGDLNPSQLATCMLKQHGKLSKAGETTVGSRRAIVLRDAGNRPGGQPGTLAIAASGTPYPLKVTATGKQQPGGSGGTCGGSSPGADGTLTLSDFGHMGKLKLPAHPISLRSLEHNTAQPTAPNA